MSYAVQVARRAAEAWFDCQADDERFAAHCEVLSLPLPDGAGRMSVAPPFTLIAVAVVVAVVCSGHKCFPGL